MFSNRVLIKILVPKSQEVTEDRKKYITRSSLIRKPQLISFGRRDLGGRDGRGDWSVWRRKERHTGSWLENLNDGAYVEDPGVNRSIILKWVLEK